MRTRSTPAFGTEPTRLHAGKILLVAGLLLVGAVVGWKWLFHARGKGNQAAVESSTAAGWTAAQQMYERPEVKVEAPAPKPLDLTAAELARIRAMLAQMQAELDALKNRKMPVATPPAQPQAKVQPAQKVPGGMMFVSHDIKDQGKPSSAPEYVLAPGATMLPCILETAINSDVQGNFVAKISANVYDTATGRHLLVPQGSSVLGRDASLDLLYGNARLPTFSMTLALPDGRSVDLGNGPVVDQAGTMGLTGNVNNHYLRLLGAVLIGGALRGGVQALQTSMAQAAGAGPFVSGYGSVVNQAVSPRLGRALDTRPTITIDAGQICNVLLIKPLSLVAMWE